MIKALSFTLRQGLEVAVVLAAVSILVQGRGAGRSRSVAFLLAVLLSLPLAYNFNLLGGREAWSGALGLSMGTSALGLLLFRKKTGVAHWLGVGLTAALTLLRGTDIALFPRYVFLETVSVLNSEVLLTVAGLVLGVSATFVVFILLREASKHLFHWKIITAGGVLLLVAFGQLVTGVKVLVVYGVIPMYSWLVDLLIPLINGQELMFFSAIIFNLVMLGMALYMNQRVPEPTKGNPAQRRKERAQKLRAVGTVQASLAVMLVVVAVLGVSAVYANRVVELSEAVPVEGQGGKILIPLEVLQDNNLHRFAYSTSEGTKVRFIAIHKGSGVYGVGLDACEICGTTGYYQRKDEVVCLNCDVVISIPTVGFPGGCNPIPLKARVEGDYLVVETAELEDNVEVFD